MTQLCRSKSWLDSYKLVYVQYIPDIHEQYLINKYFQYFNSGLLYIYVYNYVAINIRILNITVYKHKFNNTCYTNIIHSL